MENSVRYTLIAFIAALVIVGCGSKAAAPPTPTATVHVYRDPTLHFSFAYPTNWTIVNGKGHYTSIHGVKTYIVEMGTTSPQVGARITVDQNRVDYSTIPEGKIANDPNGGPDTFHYHHLKVSGWPSIQIERFNGTQIDGIDTITNTHQYSYDVQMITPNPPFPSTLRDDYQALVRSLKLPF